MQIFIKVEGGRVRKRYFLSDSTWNDSLIITISWLILKRPHSLESSDLGLRCPLRTAPALLQKTEHGVVCLLDCKSGCVFIVKLLWECLTRIDAFYRVNKCTCHISRTKETSYLKKKACSNFCLGNDYLVSIYKLRHSLYNTR